MPWLVEQFPQKHENVCVQQGHIYDRPARFLHSHNGLVQLLLVSSGRRELHFTGSGLVGRQYEALRRQWLDVAFWWPPGLQSDRFYRKDVHCHQSSQANLSHDSLAHFANFRLKYLTLDVHSDAAF